MTPLRREPSWWPTFVTESATARSALTTKAFGLIRWTSLMFAVVSTALFFLPLIPLPFGVPVSYFDLASGLLSGGKWSVFRSLLFAGMMCFALSAIMNAVLLAKAPPVLFLVRAIIVLQGTGIVAFGIATYRDPEVLVKSFILITSTLSFAAAAFQTRYVRSMGGA